MHNILSRKCETEYFDTSKPDSYVQLGDCIIKYMSNFNLKDMTPVILCIGTDRATGDCLGPLVGEQLFNYNHNYMVFGNLSSPVHALNIRETIFQIKNTLRNPFVIAVDASLGLSPHIGSVTVSNCPIYPGKGVHKKLPAIGDISITGIVNLSGQSPSVLQNTRLFTVMQLADCISEALKYSINYFEDF